MACRIITARTVQEWRSATQWLNDRNEPDPVVETTVREIIANVRENGDAALIEYTKKFDCPDFAPPIRLNPREISRGAAAAPAEVRELISAAAANIRSFHEAQLERSWFITGPDGAVLGQRVLPVEAAGLYVPGGKGGTTPLISSLLMNAIPALVAGCSRVAVVTPPREDGTIDPSLLAAAHLLDIDELYRVGGAWAIAALALGTRSIPRVDVIAGPGNIYVTIAKRLLQGKVGIDMAAGPSEVLILADSGAKPAWLAADMLAQAEHDPMASSICLVDNQRQAEAVNQELERQCQGLPRASIASASITDWSCIGIVPGILVAIEIANTVAPEHLELCVRDPWALMPAITNAGAIFMGSYSPEPLGDYYAGPNHVLPTMGTARFSSALSVSTFTKKTSIIAATRAFMAHSAAPVAALARLEGLEAHARSAEIRNGRI